MELKKHKDQWGFEYIVPTPELQEAWDKQQPMQVNEYKQGIQCECPVCRERVHENYCPNCGQKLKWFDE